MVATAMSNVNGIERESATSNASFEPEIPFNTIAESSLDVSISTVISNAPEATPSKGKALRSNEAPTWIKKRGIKNQIFTQSYGEAYPICENRAKVVKKGNEFSCIKKEDYYKSRRVIIAIVRDKKEKEWSFY